MAGGRQASWEMLLHYMLSINYMRGVVLGVFKLSPPCHLTEGGTAQEKGWSKATVNPILG